jgi:CheY-like chemotaxis protein
LCPGQKESNYSFQLSPRTSKVQPYADRERRVEGERRRHSSNDIPPASEVRRGLAPATLHAQAQNPRSFSSRLASSFSYSKGIVTADPPSTPITLQPPRRTFFTNYASSGLLPGLGTGRPPSAILEASCEGSEAFPTSECLHAGCFSGSGDLLAAAVEASTIADGTGIVSNTTSSAPSPHERSPGRDSGPGVPEGFYSTDPGPTRHRDTENNDKSPSSVGAGAKQNTSDIAKSLTIEEDVNLNRESDVSQSLIAPTLLILIADDSPLTRKMTKRVLQFQGHDVIEAGDGQACLDLVASRARTGISVDIILVVIILQYGIVYYSMVYDVILYSIS